MANAEYKYILLNYVLISLKKELSKSGVEVIKNLTL